MIERLKPLAARIRQSQESLEENAEAIRSSGVSLQQERLIKPVSNHPLSLSVCAVDGGLLADRLFGADILVRRSVAAYFTYQNSRLVSVQYYPRKFPDPEVDFRLGLDEHEAMQFRSLFRLRGELDAAIAALEMFRPDYLLLDGSIVLLGSDKPSDRSPLSGEYNALLKTYKALYHRCEAQGCQLVGLIKDSRGKRLVECLQDQLIIDVPDTMLAQALLRERERTCALDYTMNSGRHPVLSGLDQWAQKVRLFYLKPSESDAPLRVEFLQSGRSADEVASTINALSSICRNYAYPAALIEADMCAALDPLEMEKIKRSLFVLTGGASRPLRRQNRPFR